MLVYNVTTHLHWNIHEDWLRWMQEVHIPEVLETGCFTGSSLLRLLEVDEAEGPTYAVQYHAATHADYQRYLAEHASRLRQSSIAVWGNRVIAFRSLMELVK